MRPRWGNDTALTEFLQETAASDFDAVELGLPNEASQQQEIVTLTAKYGLGIIGEVATGDWWVPQAQRSDQDHLDDLRQALDACAACNAWQLNAMTGYDAWSITQSVDFLARCQAEAKSRNVLLCIETHRSRSLNTP